jgi:Domain of unknown function (DUF1839)
MGLNTASVFQLDPSHYERHALHTQARAWPESNCYVDLWIELLHAAGYSPWASLGFTFATDYELDQFTFFKPPPADLEALYGVSVYELSLWRPLLDHALVHLQRGALLLAEVDSYYLPDTSATDYRRAHVKTTIGIESLDVERRALGYFHNAGYFVLDGADFDGVLQIEPKLPETHLPPYVELVRLPAQPPVSTQALLERSLELARAHLRRRPAENPVERYRQQLHGDIDWLLARELEIYHRYAFSMLRQLGASAELAALYLGWVERQGGPDLQRAAAELNAVSEGAKALILKLARAVSSKRKPDVASLLESMALCWDRGMGVAAEKLSA